MERPFERIGLIAKIDDPAVGGTLGKINAFLTERGLRVFCDEAAAQTMSVGKVEATTLEELRQKSDLAIVVGGDGTILKSARALADYDVPIVGINQGHLGFLTDISQEDMIRALEAILDGHYITEQRFLLQCTIRQDGREISVKAAFNDVVIHKWNVARLIQLDVYINGQFVNSQRSDGLIVSTPTGSTAYALSAGGPLLYPTLNAISLVPVNPHTLSNRPLVVDSDSQIEVVVMEKDHDNVRITCDGQVSTEIVAGARIEIRKKDKAIRLIHPSDHSHYEILRAKLNWR